MLSQEEKRKVEGEYGFARIVELQVNPIDGKFDLEHIRAINQYIFQDLPKLGAEYMEHYTPGKFRPEVQKNVLWTKHRKMPHIDQESIIVYSNMDKKTMIDAENFLKDNIDIKKMSRMTRQNFTKKISDIYVQLDYVHLFPDGNSRTLREFTRGIALKSGFNLQWEVFNENQEKRNALYIARDLSVNQIALERTAVSEVKYDIEMYMKPFERYKKLSDLLKGSVCKIDRNMER